MIKLKLNFRICLQLSFFFALVLFTNFTNAQWIQSSGPAGGECLGIIAAGDTLYASNSTHVASGTYGTVGTFFMSTDHGQTWVADTIGISGVVIDVAYIGDTIFASTANNGLFRKIGSTWTPLSTPTLGTTFIFVHNRVLYISSYTYGTWKSTDYGNSFTSSGPLYPYSISKYGAIGDTIYGATQDGLYKNSTGFMWNNVYSDAIDVTTNDTELFITTQNGGVMKSTDFGSTWTPSDIGLPRKAEAIFSAGDTLYTVVTDTAQNTYVYRSFDDGQSWNPCGPGFPTRGHSHRFTKIGNEIFVSIAGHSASVYHTTNHGNTWEQSNSGLANLEVYDVYNYNNILFAGSASYDGIHKSVDGGVKWQASGNGIANNTSHTPQIKSFGHNNSFLFASDIGEGIYQSNDSGATWVKVNNGLSPNGLFTYSLFVTDSFALAGTGGGVYRTVNNGQFWDITSMSLSAQSIVNHNNVLYAGTTNGIWKSLDYGSSWAIADSGMPAFNSVFQVIVRGSDLIAATETGIFISYDQAVTWNIRNNGITFGTNALSVAANGDTLIASFIYPTNSFGRMYISADDGLNWFSYDRPGYLYEVNKLRIIGDTLFAATTTHSIWKRALSDSIFITSVPTINNQQLLIYPNPANSKINFRAIDVVPNLCLLEIFDFNGRLVSSQSISNGLELDLSEFINGIYFARIIGKDFVRCSKFIVQK